MSAAGWLIFATGVFVGAVLALAVAGFLLARKLP